MIPQIKQSGSPELITELHHYTRGQLLNLIACGERILNNIFPNHITKAKDRKEAKKDAKAKMADALALLPTL